MTRVADLAPGALFTFHGLGDRPTTLPLFARCDAKHAPKLVMNLATGTSFNVIDLTEEVDLVPPIWTEALYHGLARWRSVHDAHVTHLALIASLARNSL